MDVRGAFARLLVAAPALIASAAGACSPSAPPDAAEETPVYVDEVPEVVRAAGEELSARLGAGVEGWYWDAESGDWEARLSGTARRAELDLTPEGRFAELELVYELEEVDAALPEIGRRMRRLCGAETGLFVELSFRREAFLDDLPALAEAWGRSGVVLEFQCPGGRDFELDGNSAFVTRPDDDPVDR